MAIEEVIQIHGADAVFIDSAAGKCEDYAPLRAMRLEEYDTSDAAYIVQRVYSSMTSVEKEAFHREAEEDDPAVS